MIKAAIFNNGFVITGHADYAARGEDIVCAGVSALAQATCFSLDRIKNVSFDMRDGDMSVHIINPDIISNAMLEVLENGIHLISKEFPGYISLKIERDVNYGAN